MNKPFPLVHVSLGDLQLCTTQQCAWFSQNFRSQPESDLDLEPDLHQARAHPGRSRMLRLKKIEGSE